MTGSVQVTGSIHKGRGNAWNRATVKLNEADIVPIWPPVTGLELRNLFFVERKGQ